MRNTFLAEGCYFNRYRSKAPPHSDDSRGRRVYARDPDQGSIRNENFLSDGARHDVEAYHATFPMGCSISLNALRTLS